MNTIWVTKNNRKVFRNWILTDSQVIHLLRKVSGLDIKIDNRMGLRPNYKVTVTDELEKVCMRIA